MTREEQIRKKAKELGQQYFPDSSNIWARSNVEACYVENACVEMAEWLDQHPQWIPVEERLPEMYERVLVAGLDKRSKLKEPLLFVTCRAKEECGIECDSNGFSVGDMPFAYKKVTHWMPIVPPRKEDKK